MENEYGLPVRNYSTALANLPITKYTKNSIVLFDAVDHVYDLKQTSGPIFESNMRGVLRLLMTKKSDKFISTIVEFPYFYLNYAFRKWLLKDQDDPHVKDFAEESERSGGDADIKNISPYVTSKFNRFVMDTTLKRIVGQEKTAFNFEEIIMCEKRRCRSIFLRFLWLNKNTLKALSI